MDSTSQPSSSTFEGYADLPGVRLWYVDSGGSGVPLVLLHANTGNADGWQYNILGFVGAGYRAIAFDRLTSSKGHDVGDGGAAARHFFAKPTITFSGTLSGCAV